MINSKSILNGLLWFRFIYLILLPTLGSIGLGLQYSSSLMNGDLFVHGLLVVAVYFALTAYTFTFPHKLSQAISLIFISPTLIALGYLSGGFMGWIYVTNIFVVECLALFISFFIVVLTDKSWILKGVILLILLFITRSLIIILQPVYSASGHSLISWISWNAAALAPIVWANFSNMDNVRDERVERSISEGAATVGVVAGLTLWTLVMAIFWIVTYYFHRI